MTGAPSTKPPAVIGRESASFTGACALPVLMPLCWPRAGSFSGGLCCAAPRLRRTERDVARTAMKQGRPLDWRDNKDGIEPQVGRQTQLESSHKDIKQVELLDRRKARFDQSHTRMTAQARA